MKVKNQDRVQAPKDPVASLIVVTTNRPRWISVSGNNQVLKMYVPSGTNGTMVRVGDECVDVVWTVAMADSVVYEQVMDYDVPGDSVVLYGIHPDFGSGVYRAPACLTAESQRARLMRSVLDSRQGLNPVKLSCDPTTGALVLSTLEIQSDE